MLTNKSTVQRPAWMHCGRAVLTLPLTGKCFEQRECQVRSWIDLVSLTLAGKMHWMTTWVCWVCPCLPDCRENWSERLPGFAAVFWLPNWRENWTKCLPRFAALLLSPRLTGKLQWLSLGLLLYLCLPRLEEKNSRDYLVPKQRTTSTRVPLTTQANDLDTQLEIEEE